MLAGSRRDEWLVVAWREVAVGSGGGQTLFHSGGGQSTPEVVRGGSLDFGRMKWWVAMVAGLCFTPVVVGVLQRWLRLGGQWWLGGYSGDK